MHKYQTISKEFRQNKKSSTLWSRCHECHSGGAGDVARTLPKALAKRGHRVMVYATALKESNTSWSAAGRTPFEQEANCGCLPWALSRIPDKFVDTNGSLDGGAFSSGKVFLLHSYLSGHLPVDGVPKAEDSSRGIRLCLILQRFHLSAYSNSSTSTPIPADHSSKLVVIRGCRCVLFTSDGVPDLVELEMLLELYPKHWPREDIVVLGVSHVVDFSDNGLMMYTLMCQGNTQRCTSGILAYGRQLCIEDTFLLYDHPSFEIGEDGKVIQKFFQLGLKVKSATSKALNVEAMLEEISNEFLDPI
ncbi:hypothetical protein ZIOFF_063241 [Zingiber officinale]|uniref:Starch synthase catalytic domain-containing protein n=1 Tax=Zingiber officinale TaxID=94328 RepID=A0A8J5F1D7_ZINOF|nr:hypothetical protein ZIOFF_063241 [Zingiber officinale]